MQLLYYVSRQIFVLNIIQWIRRSCLRFSRNVQLIDKYTELQTGKVKKTSYSSYQADYLVRNFDEDRVRFHILQTVNVTRWAYLPNSGIFFYDKKGKYYVKFANVNPCFSVQFCSFVLNRVSSYLLTFNILSNVFKIKYSHQ